MNSSRTNKDSALLIAGIIFFIIGLVHLIRVFVGFGAIIANLIIPIWVSIIAFVIFFILAIWMFMARRS